MKKKHLAACMSHLCTKIISYPVTFKQLGSLKVAAMLDLGVHLGEETDIPLKSLRNNARTKVFEGTPMSINTDGSEEKGTTAIGFVIYDGNGEELVHKGDVDFGSASNEAELYAILQALSFVVTQGWKYAGDYLHLKSDSALAIWFLTQEWKAEVEGLYELV